MTLVCPKGHKIVLVKGFKHPPKDVRCTSCGQVYPIDYDGRPGPDGKANGLPGHAVPTQKYEW